LPAEFAGFLNQGFLGGGEQLFLAGGGRQLVETEAPIPQHIGVISLEVPSKIVLSFQGQIVEMPQPGRVLGEPALGVGAQQIEIILVGDLFDFLDVAKGRVRIDPYLPFLGRPEDLVVKRLFLAADAVGVIVERELVLAQKLECLAFVDAVDATVPGTDELLRMSVVIGDQPVDHMLALDLLQFDGGQILGQYVAKIEVVPQIGAPFLDGAGAAVQLDGAHLDGMGVDQAANLVGGFLSEGDELIVLAANGLEQPFVAVFVGPELLFMCAADSGLAGFLEF